MAAPRKFDHAEAVRRYAAGESPAELAFAFGVSDTAIRAALRAAGVEARSYKRRQRLEHGRAARRDYGENPLRPDPPVREDGRCALLSCGKPRKVSRAQRKYAGVAIDVDPFCSSRCCRIWHGCTVTGDDGEFDGQIKGGENSVSPWRGSGVAA